MKFLQILILIFFLAGYTNCSNKPTITIEETEEGKLLSYYRANTAFPYRSEYYRNDTMYKREYFDSNGDVAFSTLFRGNDSAFFVYTKYENVVERTQYYESGIKYVSHIFDSVEHGVSRYYSNDTLLEERLYFYGKLIAFRNFHYKFPQFYKITESIGLSEIADYVVSTDSFSCFIEQSQIRLDEDKYDLKGHYFLKEDNTIDYSSSNFYKLDIIPMNDSIKVSVFGNIKFENRAAYLVIPPPNDVYSNPLSVTINEGEPLSGWEGVFRYNPLEYIFCAAVVSFKNPQNTSTINVFVFDDLVRR